MIERFYVATRRSDGQLGGLLVGPFADEQRAWGYVPAAEAMTLNLLPAVKNYSLEFRVVQGQARDGVFPEGKLNSRLGWVPDAVDLATEVTG